jgi:poly-gamma-glutamate capsule biosynthesis protein CapA/YwtB (metallophosphatase superfamily)
VGDILLHAPVIADGRSYAGGNGYAFDPMFDDVRDVISAADLSICHQETPISADNRDLSPLAAMSFTLPARSSPRSAMPASTPATRRRTHTWDRGLAGIRSTLDVLDAAGIGHAGSARDQGEADAPPIYEVEGVKVGHLAFTYTIYNEAVPDARAGCGSRR